MILSRDFQCWRQYVFCSCHCFSITLENMVCCHIVEKYFRYYSSHIVECNSCHIGENFYHPSHIVEIFYHPSHIGEKKTCWIFFKLYSFSRFLKESIRPTFIYFWTKRKCAHSPDHVRIKICSNNLLLQQIVLLFLNNNCPWQFVPFVMFNSQYRNVLLSTPPPTNFFIPLPSNPLSQDPHTLLSFNPAPTYTI